MERLSERVDRHYEARWGEPVRRAVFSDASRAVHVYKWSESQTGEGVTIYATSGLSDLSLSPAEPTHRVELFVGLRPEDDRIARPLARLALQNDPENPCLLHGHSLTLQEPFWPGCAFSAWLFLNPREPIVTDLALGGGEHVHFLQAVPVFDSELAYRSENSLDQLLALWMSNTIPFWSLERDAPPASPA